MHMGNAAVAQIHGFAGDMDNLHFAVTRDLTSKKRLPSNCSGEV